MSTAPPGDEFVPLRQFIADSVGDEVRQFIIDECGGTERDVQLAIDRMTDMYEAGLRRKAGTLQ